MGGVLKEVKPGRKCFCCRKGEGNFDANAAATASATRLLISASCFFTSYANCLSCLSWASYSLVWGPLWLGCSFPMISRQTYHTYMFVFLHILTVCQAMIIRLVSFIGPPSARTWLAQSFYWLVEWNSGSWVLLARRVYVCCIRFYSWSVKRRSNVSRVSWLCFGFVVLVVLLTLRRIRHTFE